MESSLRNKVKNEVVGAAIAYLKKSLKVAPITGNLKIDRSYLSRKCDIAQIPS